MKSPYPPLLLLLDIVILFMLGEKYSCIFLHRNFLYTLNTQFQSTTTLYDTTPPLRPDLLILSLKIFEQSKYNVLLTIRSNNKTIKWYRNWSLPRPMHLWFVYQIKHKTTTNMSKMLIQQKQIWVWEFLRGFALLFSSLMRSEDCK